MVDLATDSMSVPTCMVLIWWEKAGKDGYLGQEKWGEISVLEFNKEKNNVNQAVGGRGRLH